MKRSAALPIVCYVMLIAAWAIDLITPQLLIAAILLNGPIALSGLALSGRLTASMVIFAEVANAVAGYLNGVQAGYHWNAIAVENRVLCAASFIFVGYLTTIVQDYARQAGQLQERTRAVSRERRLRKALEAVRETLNTDVVLRAIAREAAPLMGAQQALLLRIEASSQQPQWYFFESDLGAVRMESKRLDANLNTIVSKLNGGTVVALEPTYPIARNVLDAHHAQFALATRLQVTGEWLCLFVFYDATPDPGAEELLQSFAEGADVALAQASLYGQLAARAL
jgi:GAF domain